MKACAPARAFFVSGFQVLQEAREHHDTLRPRAVTGFGVDMAGLAAIKEALDALVAAEVIAANAMERPELVVAETELPI